MENLPEIPIASPHWGLIAVVAIATALGVAAAIFGVVQQAIRTKKAIQEDQSEDNSLDLNRPIQSNPNYRSVEPSDEIVIGTIEGSSPPSAFTLPEKIQQTDGVDAGELDWEELQQRLSRHPGEFRTRSDV